MSVQSRQIKQWVKTYEQLKSEKSALTIENGAIITKLGIQAPPGTKFLINNGEVYINQYGIYELDLSEGLGGISSLVLVGGSYSDEAEKSLADKIYGDDNNISSIYDKIIVDMVYYSSEQGGSL